MGAGTSRYGQIHDFIQAPPRSPDEARYRRLQYLWHDLGCSALQLSSTRTTTRTEAATSPGCARWIAPMAVLPPYDHGIRTQERKIDNNDLQARGYCIRTGATVGAATTQL